MADGNIRHRFDVVILKKILTSPMVWLGLYQQTNNLN
jgi:hypothetical protein